MMGTAQQTFKKAHSRAEYLHKLAVGMTNIRQRKMRRDWAKTFGNIMHWNNDANFDRIDGKDVVLIIKPGASLKRSDFDHSSVGDLYRAALVLAVSAMDAYYHAKVLHYIIAESKKKSASKSLLNTKITVEDFVRGNTMKRRNAALRSAMERHLSYESFQAPEKIKNALNLIGVEDFWTKVARKMNLQKKEVTRKIEGIVKRRNQVAHEGDVSQSMRARNKDREIKPNFVRDSLDFLKILVDASEVVINEVVRPRSSRNSVGTGP